MWGFILLLDPFFQITFLIKIRFLNPAIGFEVNKAVPVVEDNVEMM